jgi:NADH:ubiquinone oxidoreductase subunit 2 (subunit N)
VIIINLGGIPPLAGFLAKWVVFTERVKLFMRTLVTLMLVIRRVNLFVYLRIVNVILRNNSISNQKRNKIKDKKARIMVYFINIFPVTIMSIYRRRLKKGLF